MLTATYSIMVLKSEQKKARNLVSNFEQFLLRDAHRMTDPAWLRQAFGRLAAIYDYCSARKVDLYLIPAIRNLSGGVHALLDNLDTRTLYNARILDYVRKQLRQAGANSDIDSDAVMKSMQLYCKQMHERFLVEDGELLPLACRVLTEGDWFAIASKCLSHVETGVAKSDAPNSSAAARQPQDEYVLAH